MSDQPTPWVVEMRVTLNGAFKGDDDARKKDVFVALNDDLESRGIMEPVVDWIDPYTLFISLASVAIDAKRAASTAEEVVTRRLTTLANLAIRELTVEATRPITED